MCVPETAMAQNSGGSAVALKPHANSCAQTYPGSSPTESVTFANLKQTPDRQSAENSFRPVSPGVRFPAADGLSIGSTSPVCFDRDGTYLGAGTEKLMDNQATSREPKVASDGKAVRSSRT